MDSSKLARALGYDPFDPWPLHDDHVPTHRDWHREGPRGSPGLLAEVLYKNPQGRMTKHQASNHKQVPNRNDK
jgi:dTDP-4-dehydrorhamnose reductase